MKKEFTHLIRSIAIAGFRVISSLPSVVSSSFVIIFFIGTTILFPSNFLHAVTVNVYPTEDTYIDSDYPDDNYVGAIYIDVYKYVFSWGEIDEEFGLLKFDLLTRA